MENGCSEAKPRIGLSEDGILEKFDDLVKAGGVLYDEDQETVPYTDEHGLQFRFFVAPILGKKGIGRKQSPKVEVVVQPPRCEPGSDISIEGFEICDVGGDHRLTANKFCFTRPLMLLLTKDGFKRQFHPLEHADLAASWALVRGMPRSDLLVFYNCGEPAGFSRLHRHVQVIPLPKAPEGYRCFLDDEELVASGKLPFLFRRRALPAGETVTAGMLTGLYAELLEEMAAASPYRWGGPGTDVPHNFFLTRRWIAVVPRRRAIHHEVNTNALGMLGMVAVPSRGNMQDWVRRGCSDLLTVFGIPKDGKERELVDEEDNHDDGDDA